MAYPFAAAEVLTAVDLNAMIGAPTQNTQTGTTYTAVLLDAGKTVTLSNASAVTLTIPAQASVSWADNTQLNFLNLGAGTVTITPAAGVTINGTPLTLATSKGGSLVRTASNTWTFIPFSAGEGAANFTNTATGTYTDAGISYKYITFTGSGDLTVDRAGFADILVVGGGAGGGPFYYAGGGGAGGHLYATGVYLPLEVIAVTVGAGGASNSAGNFSRLGNLVSIGGGSQRVSGGSGGGATGGNGSGTNGIGLLNGNSGGFAVGSSGNAGGGGGGGGAGSVGGNASGSNSNWTGGTGGDGLSNSITGSGITRSAGGGGGAYITGGPGGSGGGGAGSYNGNAIAGTVNTGSGGGGVGYASGLAGTGGSGLVIVRVVV